MNKFNSNETLYTGATMTIAKELIAISDEDADEDYSPEMRCEDYTVDFIEQLHQAIHDARVDQKELADWAFNMLQIIQAYGNIRGGIGGMGSDDGDWVELDIGKGIGARFELDDDYAVTTGARSSTDFIVTPKDNPNVGFTAYYDDGEEFGDGPKIQLNWFDVTQ
jgi:hypothetical protein